MWDCPNSNPFGVQHLYWHTASCLPPNGGLFSSPTNVGHHNPPPSGSSVIAGTLFFLQSTWDRPQIHPPLGPNVFTGTPPRVYPFRGTARRLTHRPVSGSDTICNDLGPLLADMVFFGLSLSGFPLKALRRVC